MLETWDRHAKLKLGLITTSSSMEVQQTQSEEPMWGSPMRCEHRAARLGLVLHTDFRAGGPACLCPAVSVLKNSKPVGATAETQGCPARGVLL